MRLPFFLALCALASAAIDLKASDFHSTTSAQKWSFVAFTAPWCGHCQQLKPEFEQVAVDGVSIYNVDASGDDAETVRKSFGVSGFPTLILFKNGELFEKFGGARTKDGIESFLHEKTKAVLVEVTDVTSFFATKSDSLWLLKTPSNDSAEFKTFAALAENNNPGAAFGWIAVDEPPSLIIRQNLEQSQISFDDMTSLEIVYERYRYPSVFIINDDFAKYAPALLHAPGANCSRELCKTGPFVFCARLAP